MSGQHESWVERRIRDAQERGAFDNLPGAGKPLGPLGDPEDDDWWIRGLIEREHLDMSAALPPNVALRKEAQALPEVILKERSEQAVREILEDFNARVRECWRRPADGPLVGPRIVARTVDVERLVEHWRAHRPARPAGDARPRPAQGGPEHRRGGTCARLRRVIGWLTGSSERNR